MDFKQELVIEQRLCVNCGDVFVPSEFQLRKEQTESGQPKQLRCDKHKNKGNPKQRNKMVKLRRKRAALRRKDAAG